MENKLSKDYVINLTHSQIDDEFLADLKGILLASSGKCPVFIEIQMPGKGQVNIKTSKKYSVTLTENVHNEIRDLVGRKSLVPQTV